MRITLLAILGLAGVLHTCVTPAAARALPLLVLAPVNEYLMPTAAEVALARSAAPARIAGQATVLVLTRRGYKTAAPGANGWICLVERSWGASMNDPQFWNPKIRAPLCLNPPAARTYLPIILMRTRLLLSGKSASEAFRTVESALRRGVLPSIELGSMSYMMSKKQYLNDAGKNWYPHVMFFVPTARASSWGANVHGSPVIAADDREDKLTLFLIPVSFWSDGSVAPRWSQ